MDNTLSVILILVGFVASMFIFAQIVLSQIKKLKEQSGNAENAVLMEWLKSMKQEVSSSIDKNSQTLEQQLNIQRQTLEQQLKSQREAMSEQTKTIWQRLDSAQDVIRGVQKQLGGIEEFGKDMKDLSNILKSPKLRGGLGEQILYDILANFLPSELYKTQYKFKDGNICDAIIITDKGMIPVDSKFPLENFKLMATLENPEEREKAKKAFVMDVKKRIDEIASKYILPAEGTTEQAVMYVPSENVYYELIVNTPQIEEYSRQKSVLLASPNTISYLLKVVLVAYKQHELQKHTVEILKSLSGLKIEAGKFTEELNVLEKHISNSYKSVDGVKSRFSKFLNKLENISQIETTAEPPKLL